MFLSTFGVEDASAHVKWFCAFDVAGQPQGLENVLCPNFETLVGLSIICLVIGCLMERTVVGDAMMRSLDRVTSGLHAHTELLFRVVLACFLIALWTMGGVLLTPELKTASPIVPWLQLVMAAGLFWRRTMPFTAFGICVLYAIAIRDYGIFHLADYPIFLGVAIYLALCGLQKNLFGLRPLDVVRWAAAITLMWASIEKWAYPQWSSPLFITHPNLAMGFDTDFFMRAAGVVEFTLSFALIWTPLARRVAAAILAGMFIAAIFEFGALDAIGHSPIIVVLLAIVADNVRAPLRARQLVLAPVGYAASLAAFLGIYYLAHVALYGAPVT